MPRTAQPSRRALRPKAEYHDYYNLVFRGYIEDRNVSRKDDSKIKTFNQVCKSDDICGVFLSGIVMVDVDDGNNANIIQRILDDYGVSYLFANTTRGKHFFFYHGKWSKVLRDRSHIVAAVGLEVDYKCYSVDCSPLSKTLDDGTVQPRPLLTSPNWTGDLVDLPHFLVPVDAKEDFTKLTDCRNETFYIYILKLLRYGLDKEQTKHTIRLINNYVIPNSLSDRELNIVLRDEAFPDEDAIITFTDRNGKNAKINYKLAAERFSNKFNCCFVDDTLFYKVKDYYEPCSFDFIQRDMYDTFTSPNKRLLEEICYGISKVAPIKNASNRTCTPFKNGLYDFDKGAMVEYDKDEFFFNKIPFNYNKNAEPVKIVDDFLNGISCYKHDVGDLILEMIGYCLYPNNKLGKMFFLDGITRNGKSTLFEFISYCIGQQNISNLNIQDLAAKYDVKQLDRKLVNIGDDVPLDYIPDSSVIKKLVTGETVITEEKFKAKESMKFKGKLLFSGNGLPKFSGMGAEAIIQRFVIIPMNADFKDGKGDKDLIKKLCTPKAAEYLISLAMEAIQDVLKTGHFTDTEESKEALTEYHKDLDSVLRWMDEITPHIDGRKTSDVLRQFNVYALENGYQEISQTLLTKKLRNYGYKSDSVKIAGKSVRVYKLIN
ncbi:DNA primase family protein [Cellulosilyticum sp. WCF-2]|uniref:DNA primase family protein n=1 Tax=Cellulosilyticum sp. WCF-2 TaxID=2497860 RepID=UPI000F8F7B7D|nr:DNA primase family protein [Cellulosilyticum sp. WCF-2]QEH70512.1 hypothetical protein EKH84_19740 [Cellulosilyticum sp. WCF-2]